MTTSLHILSNSLFNHHHTSWSVALPKIQNKLNGTNAHLRNSDNLQPPMSHASTRWMWVVSYKIQQLYPCRKGPTKWKLGGPQNWWFGFFQKDKNFLPLPQSTISWLSSPYTNHYKKKYTNPVPVNFIMCTYCTLLYSCSWLKSQVHTSAPKV